jgi:type II secretory pathway pseudopilin PulG
VAIIIVALTILAITPPILLATGTRVQSRRAEQANHIAQAEIDRVRTLMERGITDVNLLPASAGAVSPQPLSTVAVANSTISNSPLMTASGCGLNNAPNSTARYPYPPPPFTTPPTVATTPLPVNTLVLVDVDGDCQPDYVMQVFRNNGQTVSGASTTTTLPSTFDMGVRVYSYFPGEALPPLDTNRASLVAGTNARDRQVAGKRQPLAVLYTTISVNTQSSALGRFCQQKQQDRGSNTQCSF